LSRWRVLLLSVSAMCAACAADSLSEAHRLRKEGDLESAKAVCRRVMEQHVGELEYMRAVMELAGILEEEGDQSAARDLLQQGVLSARAWARANRRDFELWWFMRMAEARLRWELGEYDVAESLYRDLAGDCYRASRTSLRRESRRLASDCLWDTVTADADGWLGRADTRAAVELLDEWHARAGEVVSAERIEPVVRAYIRIADRARD
jgi:hypothetical protein